MTKETENISKIRDILFGNNLTELEKRTVKTEVSLRDEIAAIDEKFSLHIEEIKSSSKTTYTTLEDALLVEKKQRETETLQMHEELTQLQNRMQQFDEKLTTEINSIKQLLNEQNETFVKQQKKALSDLKTQFLSQLEDIRQSKVERSALAVLLSEIAMQLVDKEPENPEATE